MGRMWSKELSKDFLKSRQISTEIPPGTSSVVVPIDTAVPSSSVTSSLRAQKITDSQTPIVAITAASLAFIVVFIFAFYFLRHCHQVRKCSEQSSNGGFKLFWSKSKDNHKKNQIPSINDHVESTSRENAFDTADTRSLEMAEEIRGPDRTASFRSVITLPSYIRTARQDEQVLGREGERGGVDVVVEFPTTADEEERRREEEMEALYQVRLARRRENETREERRRARRELREHGEDSSLGENEDAALRVDDNTAGQRIEELRANHDRLKRNRHRAVSIVSYAELGVARHDGTRVSPGHAETEKVCLLGDAASISASAHPYSPGRAASVLSDWSSSSEVPHPLMPQMSNSDSLHSFPLNMRTNVPPYVFGLEPEHNFTSSPVFATHMWDNPRVNSARDNLNSYRSTMSGIEIRNIIEENPTSDSIPHNYGKTNSPTESEELPPDYSCPDSSDDRQNANEQDPHSSTPNSIENSNNHRCTVHRSDRNGPDVSVTRTRRASLGDNPHVINSSRSRLRYRPELVIQPLPSIQINPASPTSDQGLEHRLR